MKKQQHVLVIRLSAMGDVAMVVPVVKALIEQNPSVKITVLSRSFLKPLFEGIKNVNFYSTELKKQHKGIIGVYKLYKELKRLNITAVADLHNVLRSKMLRTFFKLNAVNVEFIDKGRKEKKALTSVKNKVFKQLKTTHERYADVFRKLGFDLTISKPILVNERELTAEILKKTGSKTGKWIGIAPFAQYNSKKYPLDLMKKVIADLSKAENCKILLFGGGAKEVEALNEIAALYSNVCNVAGNLSLKEELSVISNLNVMLGMDSGNAHFAAMLGVNTITLWGVTHPYAGFAPCNQPESNCILPDLSKYPNVPCSIYGNKIYPGYEDVMRTIQPKTVVAKILNSI